MRFASSRRPFAPRDLRARTVRLLALLGVPTLAACAPEGVGSPLIDTALERDGDAVVGRSEVARSELRFEVDGPHFLADEADIGLQLVSYGRASDVLPVLEAAPELAPCETEDCVPTVRYDRADVVEWWQ